MQCGGQIKTDDSYCHQRHESSFFWVCSGKFCGSILKTHKLGREDVRYGTDAHEYGNLKCTALVDKMQWPTKFEMENNTEDCNSKIKSALLALMLDGNELFSEATVGDIMEFLSFSPYFFLIATRQLDYAGKAL